MIIHCRNKAFWAKTDRSFGKPIELVPIIFESSTGNSGVGVIYQEVFLDGYGLGGKEFITSWRATEMIRKLTMVRQENYAQVFYAARREVTEEERIDFVNPIIQEIGQETYDKIMKKPVPEEIIEKVLKSYGKGTSYPIYCIEEEIRAGTITWRDEFSEFNITP